MPSAAPTGVNTVARKWAACLLVAVPASVHADVVITRLANEGVIIEDGVATRVMIDGLVVEPYSIYGGLPDGLQPQFEQATGPFSGIDLALASHRHHDHNQPAHACTFLQRSTATLFAGSIQVMDLMREKCRSFTQSSPRIRVIDAAYDRPETWHAEAATVTAFPLSHGSGRVATVQNFGFVVELGGMRVLHVGDAAMEPADFQRAGIEHLDIDVALIPFWFFQPGPGGAILEQFLEVPHRIAVHIPPAELDEVRTLLRAEYPEVVVLENVLDQVRFEAIPASPD